MAVHESVSDAIGNTPLIRLAGLGAGLVAVGVSDKSAQEKIDILTAYGAEVVTASSLLPKQDPDHLFNVVSRLVDEIPGAWLANQYDNAGNPDAHVPTTGP